MIDDLVASLMSQDVLDETQITHKFLMGNAESWRWEFSCSKVSYTPVSLEECSNSSGSRKLPSINVNECLPNFVNINNGAFPISEISTAKGLEFLFNYLIKTFIRLRKLPTSFNLKEYINVLRIIEYIGCEVELDEDVSYSFLLGLTRFLMKVGVISEPSRKTHCDHYTGNIPFHSTLFAWRSACRILTHKLFNISSKLLNGSILTVDDAFLVLCNGLVLIKEKVGTFLICSCIQSLVIELYQEMRVKFLEILYRTFNLVSAGRDVVISCQSNVFSNLVLPPALGFFNFIIEVISHLIDIEAIKRGSEDMSARFVLLMGMGEILSEVAIVDVSESLFNFIKKYRPSGFDKIRKAAKTLFSKVSQTLEDIILIELEQRSRGNPQAWLDDVISSFSLCNAREINLIRFVVLLLSDGSLWDSSRSLVLNRYSGANMVVNGFVNTASMLLSLVSDVPDGSELATKMCSWISDSFERMDWSLYPIVFNVLDVLCLIAENKGLRIDVMPILASLMNKMSLPGSGDLFVKRYCDLARSHSEYLMLIDINRAISSLRDFDVLIFFREMCDVEYEISGTAWNKAVTMLSCQKEDDSRLLKYIVHQIRVGLQRGSIDANIRLNCVIEKLNMKGCEPDPLLLLTLCNTLLARPRQYDVNLNQFVPLWIYAVLAFSSTWELQMNQFTSLIWEGISHTIQRIDPSVEMEMTSADNSEKYLDQLFKILSELYVRRTVTVREKVALWFPVTLAQQIELLLKNADDTTKERTIRSGGTLLYRLGTCLHAIAEASKVRTGFNRTTFVILMCVLVEKLLKHPFSSDFLHNMVPLYAVSLARLPYILFVYARLKSILIGFSQDKLLVDRILKELKNNDCEEYLLHLKTKESDERIKKMMQSLI